MTKSWSGLPRQWLAVGFLLLYNLATLARVPAFLNDDDGGYASAAYQFWRTGQPGVAGYRDVVGLNHEVWAFGRIAAAVQGVFLPRLGVSVFAAQFPTWLAGAGVCLLTAALGTALWEPRAGTLAALLLAASGKFYEASRWTRPDMLLAVFFFFSLWLAATAPSGRPHTRLFAAGLVMGFAGDVHLNGFLLAPVPLAFWMVLRPEPAAVRLRASAAFAAAALVGVAYWLALHYEAFHVQAALYGGKTHSLNVAQLGFSGALKAETQRYLDWFWGARGHRHLLEGLCVAAAAIWVWRGEKRPGRALVVTWVLMFLIAAMLMSNPFGWYLILVWPLFALWMARAFLAFPRRRASELALAALLLAYALNLGAWYYRAAQDVPLAARVPELRRLIPPEAPVLGNGALWFAFWDRDFTDVGYLSFREYETQLFSGSGPTGWDHEQRQLGWRYVVASGELRAFLDPEVPLEPLIVSQPHRAERIRAARAFSLARCTIEQRLPGVADSILVLRVKL